MHGIIVARQAGEFQLICKGEDFGTADFFQHDLNYCPSLPVRQVVDQKCGAASAPPSWIEPVRNPG
jgi:hypothetical protein